jgi:hypothetical protein
MRSDQPSGSWQSPAEEQRIMPLFTEAICGTCARGGRWIGAFVVGACIAVGVDGTATAQTGEKIPRLASSMFDWGWVRIRADGRNALYGDGWLDPPAGLRGPIGTHPEHPLQGNSGRSAVRQVTLAFGNYMDPILKPWAAEQMRLSNEEVLSGKRGMPFLATSRCYPGGVPGQLLWTTEPLFFTQEPSTVHMMWQRDSLTRRIYMTDKHSEHVTPSWFGESIGRYENGEFIVDTIGLSTKMSFLDMFRTPHSEKLHVTERFKLTADEKFLEVLVKVEDEDTLNEPMYMVARWRKQEGTWQEFICAENNSDRFSHNLFPLPEAKTPDF